MNYLKLFMKGFETFCRFWYGDSIGTIRSMWSVNYANLLHEERDIDSAIKYYEKALDLSPDNYYAYGGVTAALIEKRQFDNALKYCERALSLKSEVLMHIMKFIIHNSLEDSEKAENEWQAIMKFYNDDVSAAYDRLAYTYFGYGMYDEAAKYLNNAIQIKPTEAGLHYNLAKVHSAKKEYLLAREEFSKVLQLTKNRRYRRYAEQSLKELP